jgi:CRISPR/Cas system CSM-associated protein Csm3 (group 7 of RAMP superfamily)
MSEPTMSENKLVKRVVIQVECQLLSPALIGSGFAENTDNDVLLNAKGKPFLPGSTIAGVLRAALGEEDAKRLFGKSETIGIGKNKKTITKISPLWTFDAVFFEGPKSDKPAKVISLDGVALNEHSKTAKDKNKYDYEAVNAGAGFTIRLKLVVREKDDGKELEKLLQNVLDPLLAGDISVGGKANRGFGRIKALAASKKTFVFKSMADVKEWADFTWGLWQEAQPVQRSGTYKPPFGKLEAELELEGSIMIRDTRNISNDGEDYAHIESNKQPVIFGTSWAGAMRHGLLRLGVKKAYLDEVFGKQEKEEGTEKELTAPSRVKIIGGLLEGGEKNKIVTRVKIDRFTGGAADGALYTERPYYGGTTRLAVCFPKDDRAVEQLFMLALAAIGKGLITIGGETAVGRGRFAVTKVTVDGVVKTDKLNAPKPDLRGRVMTNG